MKPTIKLYYQDAYMKDFQAVILDCASEKDGFAVVLDQTAFYPGGGGQPADTGLLDGQRVLRVFEQDGFIRHVVAQSIAQGKAIKAAIEWTRRFQFMQNHGGEHIVSGIIQKQFGYQNVGFHMGNGFVTADYDHTLSEADITWIEEAANECIYKNIEVESKFYTCQEAKARIFRSKKEFSEDVRIVDIGGYDSCACCGLHVRQTGEIGLIKISHVEKYKGGARVYMLCGEGAFADYQRKDKIVNSIAQVFSTNADAVLAAMNKHFTEYENMKQHLNLLKTEYYRWKASHYASINNQMACIFENIPKDDLKHLSLALSKKIELVAVFSENCQDGYHYVLNSNKFDVKPLGQTLNQNFKGKGGGSKEMMQGLLQGNKEEIQQHIIDYYIKISKTGGRN